MLGYLKRGEAYRRRGELEAALRDLRRRPSSTRRRRCRASCWATSTTPATASRPRREHYQAYVELDDRSPRVLYKLALARYRAGQPGPGDSMRSRRRSPSTTASRRRTTCSACASASAGDTEAALAALDRAIALAPTLLAGARRAGGSLRASRTIAGRLDAARGAARARSGAGARRHARSRLRPRRPARPRGHDAAATPPSGIPNYTYTYVALGRVWLETRRREAIASS